MPSMSQMGLNSSPPRLLAKKEWNEPAILPLLDALRGLRQNEEDISDLLIEASEDAEFRVLFEMPGMLFEDARLRAFAVAYGNEAKPSHGFVVHDPNKDMFAIMTYEEITPRAQRFYASYASVLSCLSKIPAVKKLH